MNTVVKNSFPQNMVNLLTSQATVSFQRRTLLNAADSFLHGINSIRDLFKMNFNIWNFKTQCESGDCKMLTAS